MKTTIKLSATNITVPMDKIVRFETGATTHAVNDLILFADNTESLAAIRDDIYKLFARQRRSDIFPKPVVFKQLLIAASRQYATEFPNDWAHIKNMSKKEMNEFCELYCADFEAWKQEHGF